MPLTPLQREVLAVLAQARSEESHFAGGIVLNASESSPRFSRDFDIFHEASAEVTRASNQDVANLRAAGFRVEIPAHGGEWDRETTMRTAKVLGGNEAVEIDWAADSAFRFFPIEPDPVLGWRLHMFDLATNKALALSARTETRDYVDIVELGRMYPLAAICWAACGKDPGFSPLFLLKTMRRFARIDPVTLEEIRARDLNPIELKKAWIEMSDEAETKMGWVADENPELPIGVAFVDRQGRPGWIGDDPSLQVHAPSVRGCWPTVHLG